MRWLALFTFSIIFACGPGNRDQPDDGDDTPEIDAPPIPTCTPVAEVCTDMLDNDCDQRTDCSDADCSGRDGCPVCGSVENPEGSPLPLPDGIGQSTVCSTNAQCTDPQLPNCVAKECHASYSSTLNFVGFPMDSTLQDTSKFLSVCVIMEHSWLRDLQIDLITPDDRVITLHKFVDRVGGEIFLGQANDSDTASNPVPGVGSQYCWKSSATLTMLEAPTMGSPDTLPAGDYKPVAPFTAMFGTPLNGVWEMRVTDLWPIDNGFMFEWSIAFDPSLVSDCDDPIVL